MIKLAKILSSCILAACLLAIPQEINADNAVDIGMGCLGQHDTIWTGNPATADFYFENDIALAGFSLGFQVWSQDGVTWQWEAQPDGYGPNGQETGKACVTLVPFSRMDPHGDGDAHDVFDLTDLLVVEQDVDENGRDTILCGGISLTDSMSAGPLEHMYSFHFIPGISEEATIGTFCVDSCFVPPAGDFIFQAVFGLPIEPVALWDCGGRCWPVKAPFTGPAEMFIIPDTVYAIYLYAIEPMLAEIYLPESATQYSIHEIDVSTIAINNTITPSATEYLSDDTLGEYLKIDVDMADFIGSYPLLWDTTEQAYSISGSLSDGTEIEEIGAMTMIGHMSGDANSDGQVNVGDAAFLINYVFRGGSVPNAIEAADANCDGMCNVADVVHIVNFIFKGGDAPCYR